MKKILKLLYRLYRKFTKKSIKLQDYALKVDSSVLYVDRTPRVILNNIIFIKREGRYTIVISQYANRKIEEFRMEFKEPITDEVGLLSEFVLRHQKD